MPDLLYEIGTEEIPASYIEPALGQLRLALEVELDDLRLAHGDLRPAGTAQLGDERVDGVSDVGFVAKGSRVRVIQSEGYRHVVEPVDDESVA